MRPMNIMAAPRTGHAHVGERRRGSAFQLATTLVLPAHPTSLRLARHATFAWLQFAPYRYDKDTVLLLVTEVLANALENSKGPLVLSVSAVGDQMRVEVRDAAPVGRPLGPRSMERLASRLKMVGVLAQHWGIETRLVDDQAARVVWFECAPTRVPKPRHDREGSDTLDGGDPA